MIDSLFTAREAVGTDSNAGYLYGATGVGSMGWISMHIFLLHSQIWPVIYKSVDCFKSTECAYYLLVHASSVRVDNHYNEAKQKQSN